MVKEGMYNGADSLVILLAEFEASSKQLISDLTSSLQKNLPTLGCPSGVEIQFWTHEWEKHGTCSESSLKQHDYFEITVNLKQKANLIDALTSEGIQAAGNSYNLSSIKEAIEKGVGFTPFIECNVDSSDNRQLYQVYLCVDTSGSNFIQCPVFLHGKCGFEIEFSIF
ncbi:Ribonuclease pancreatic beta-type, variant 4 [Lathyrus oleraceus]|uniref:Ribonuclease pancreatic beta-type, variant 4 n=2 Tax=Pisum sativum TaxID=3888 RepID=A0A9D4VM06_PEA|nr:Ribonuclease pancreatic beta-type, variant 4 [Pisum sativum]